MPKELEERLKKEGRKRGLKGEALDRYVYGTMRKLGWKPKRERRKVRKKTKKPGWRRW